ncbi:hypothetical protein EVG20_g626 [Dentipellis fragilis]|uniref:Uncharacterized protein n=1 Tax=Dentipellis fragilis TaxID=205917 RepID=A0A4Y9ZCR5_9AGAM|nr:hypothetical protein EVG20_g626 [Dentipellis fragilis]
MMILMTLIAAVLDLTVVIQRAPRHTTAGPAAVPTISIVALNCPSAPLNLPLAPYPTSSLPAFPPTLFVHDDSLMCPSSEIAKVAALEGELVPGRVETTGFPWLESEVSMELEIAFIVGDLIISWTGDLLPRPQIYGDFPPTTSLALFEPLPSDIDVIQPWIFILGFIFLSLSVDAAIAELRRVVGPSLGFVHLSHLHTYFGSSSFMEFFSSLKNRLNSLDIQHHLNLRLLLPVSYTQISQHYFNGFVRSVDTSHIPSPAWASLDVTRLLQRFYYCASIPIRQFLGTIRRSLPGLQTLFHYPSLRTFHLPLADLRDMQLGLEYLLDSGWIHLSCYIWEHDSDAWVFFCLGLTACIAYRLHTCCTKLIASIGSFRHDKNVLSGELRSARHSESSTTRRLEDLQQTLETVREEAISAAKTIHGLSQDNKALRHQNEESIASQTKKIDELESSLDRAEERLRSAWRLRREDYAKTDVRIRQLELDNDTCHLNITELKSALEQERATVFSLQAQLSSGHSAAFRDSSTQTGTEIDSVLVRVDESLFDGADASDLGLVDDAYESLVDRVRAADLGLEDSWPDFGTSECSIVVFGLVSLLEESDADDGSSDSDMSECSVVEGTIFIPYHPGDDYSDSEDDDDDPMEPPNPPAADAVIHQASRDWALYVAYAEQMHKQALQEKSSIISRLEQKLSSIGQDHEDDVCKLKGSLEDLQRQVSSLEICIDSLRVHARELEACRDKESKRAEVLSADIVGLRGEQEGLVRTKEDLEKEKEALELKWSQAQFLAEALRDRVDALEAKAKANLATQPQVRASAERDPSTTGELVFLSPGKDTSNSRLLELKQLESSGSTSTLDLLRATERNLSLLMEASFPEMPTWSSAISFGDLPCSPSPASDSSNSEPREESPPVLTPDRSQSRNSPSSVATSVMSPESARAPKLVITTAGPTDDSSGIADFNPLLTPSPVRPLGGKNGDAAFGFPSWASFASDISASGFTSSPMENSPMVSSPVVDDPIDLPPLPSPTIDSFDASFSPSPLAARTKPGNSNRPRQPFLSPLNINCPGSPSDLQPWRYSPESDAQ